MLIVDIILIAVLVVATVVGVRRGLMASLGLFAGLAIGGAAAYWLTPLVNDIVPTTPWRGVAVVVTAVLLLTVGAMVGGAVGRSLRRGVDRIKLRIPERILGGAVSLVAAALAMSFVSSALLTTGLPVVSTALSNSNVLRTIDSLTPPPVRTVLAQVRGAVFDDGIPRLGELFEPVIIGEAPEIALDDPALTEAAQSVAKITGVAYACGVTATGTGFVIAEDRLVTNAHVVAGVDRPIVELPGRSAREGRVVYFDPVDDLAVIAVDGLDGDPLDLADPLEVGDGAVVQGYPFGGPFTSGSAQVISVGEVDVPDIYGDDSSPRDVFALRATVQPGNSGGPLLSVDGDVGGVVFARSEGDAQLGYAMTLTELEPVAAQAVGYSDAVSSGSCTQ